MQLRSPDIHETLLLPGEGRGPAATELKLEKAGFLYIMANKRNGTIYLGVTSDLPKRVWEHRIGAVPSFTSERGCTRLVWYQPFESLDAARRRELQMKKWKRAWKIREIEGLNPDWEDLFDRLAPL